VTASERVQVERAVAESTQTARELRQLVRVKEALGQPPRVELENIDLAARVFEALSSARQRPSALRSRLPLWLGAAAALVVLVFVAPFGRRSNFESPSEFQARAANPGASEAARWAGIRIFRVSGDALPVRVKNQITLGDGLVFSYTNLGARPFEYLMIFAVDARGSVRWFYPAYECARSDPTAFGIARAAEATLPELIHQDFEPGDVSVYALFSHEALPVSAVERWLAESHGKLTALPVKDATLQTFELEVVP
jgi:hypothetical protein